MLARLHKSMRNKDQGFTLIELLVVIVIIGILAAIAIPLFLNQRKKGVDASMKSDAKSAASTVETWMVDNPSTAVPTITLATDASGGSSTALDGFRMSKGNSLHLKPLADVGSYCIDISNPGSSDSAKFVVYKSTTGGLMPGLQTSAC
jgi:prepilin-type N-terminal cleavage/methylation domain-containing protein